MHPTAHACPQDSSRVSRSIRQAGRERRTRLVLVAVGRGAQPRRDGSAPLGPQAEVQMSPPATQMRTRVCPSLRICGAFICRGHVPDRLALAPLCCPAGLASSDMGQDGGAAHPRLLPGAIVRCRSLGSMATPSSCTPARYTCTMQCGLRLTHRCQGSSSPTSLRCFPCVTTEVLHQLTWAP